MNQILMQLLRAAFLVANPAGPIGPNGAPLQHEPAPPPESFFGEVPIEQIWAFIDKLTWLQAVMIMATGVIYLIYGWRLFRALVVLNFAMMGLIAGIVLGKQLGSPLWGGILGTFMLGIVAYPFMKYAVAVLGGLAGAVLGAALWRTVTLPDALVWVGALAGLVAGGFLAFSSFKFSVMIFSSLQGAACLVVGLLALLNDYPQLSEHIANAVYTKAFLLPVMLLFATSIGIFFQQRLLKLKTNGKCQNTNPWHGHLARVPHIAIMLRTMPYILSNRPPRPRQQPNKERWRSHTAPYALCLMPSPITFDPQTLFRYTLLS